MTLEEALQLGVEAHKAGELQKADQYYTAILKKQPNHPDANHNLGVLAVGVNKVEQAIPFFRKALEANAQIEQFWISLVEALIKIENLNEAKNTINQAKENGIASDGLNQLDQKLNLQNPDEKQFQKLLNLHLKGENNRAREMCERLS